MSLRRKSPMIWKRRSNSSLRSRRGFAPDEERELEAAE
jgi:hypothetical protein